MPLDMPTIKQTYEQTNGADPDDLLEVLEQSAFAQDHDTFLDRIENVDWSKRPPEHILKAIDMALMIGGRARLAMQLAREAVRLFPHHPRCQWAARVIAPARIVGTSPSDGKDRGLRASMDWIADNFKPYRGKWVAVSFGKLVAFAASLEELDEMIKGESDPDCILITRMV